MRGGKIRENITNEGGQLGEVRENEERGSRECGGGE